MANDERTVDVQRVTVTALMAALVFILTRVVQVPTFVKGYIHLGDAGVVFTALAFGPGVAAIAGGVGTALADVTSGYAQWAIFSLIVHGLQGWVIGMLVQQEKGTLRFVSAVAASTFIVVVGYFFAGIILLGSAMAVMEILPNIIQGVSGGLIGVPLYLAARRAYPPLAHRTG